MLYYTVRFGDDEGIRLTPHLFKTGAHRGHYVASKMKGGPHEPVQMENDLVQWLRLGYSIRMSAPGHPPSLIAPGSVRGWQ